MRTALRQALRSLRLAPAFTLTVIATLAVGLGLNTAVFTVVDCVLLRPLGYRDADRLVAVRTHFDQQARSINSVASGDYPDVAGQVHGLESVAYYHEGSGGIELDGTALYLPIAQVSPRFGQVLGVEPVAGRLFDPADHAGHHVLVSEAFARDHFGSPTAALGHTVRIDGEPEPILGVLPQGFSFPGRTALWAETADRPYYTSRSSFGPRVIARLAPGTNLAALSAELATFSHRLQSAYPEDRQKSIEAIPLADQLVGSVRPTLNLLAGSVAVLLLVVFANIAHLQLVRSMRLARETGIRSALGATRRALATRLLLETAVLAVLGVAAAVMVAYPALHLLLLLAPPDLPRLAEVHLNGRVLAGSLLLSLLVMVGSALLPVWRSWRMDPIHALRQDTSRGSEGRGSRRLRGSLVVAEIALTLTLSSAGVLLARQLIAESHADLGFAPDHLVTLDVHTVSAGTASETPDAMISAAVAQARLALVDAELDTLAAMPGVRSAAAVNGAPMGFGGVDVSYAIRGRSVFAPPFEHMPNAQVRPISPTLLATLGVPLLRGRGLSDTDRLDDPPVLLINASLARAVFPGQDPLGQQVMCGFDSPHPEWWTIVGVVGDLRDDSPAATPMPTFYLPLAQHPGSAGDLQLLVRTAAAPESLVDALRKRLLAAHPDLAVQASTMRQNIGLTERADRFRTALLASFAAVSVLLALIGVYGVTAYTVAQRQFEFGLRLALGAQRQTIFLGVLRSAAALVGTGLVAGALLSVALTRVLTGLLGKLPALDPVSVLITSGALLALALAAALLPARRAAGMEPMSILRGE